MKLSPGQNAALKTAVIYACFGFIWIAFSDRLADMMIADREVLAVVNTVKGSFYVLVTAILVFFLSSGYVKNIEKAEEKYRSVFENTNDAILINETDGKIIDVNKRALEMMGTERKKVIGKNISVFLPGYEYKSDEQCVNRTFTGMLDAESLGGKKIAVEADCVAVSYGGKTRIITVAADITERLKHETEMSETMDELKRSNEDLEQFAMVSSHDLKQPLRNVSNYAELMKKKYSGKIDSDADMFLATIVTGAKQMSELIGDILAYSQAGRQANVQVKFRAADVIEEAAFEAENEFPQARVIFDKNSIPDMNGDKNSFKQVAVNLINNGLKFNRSLHPEVNIKCEDMGDQVKFSFRDNGIGIKPAYHNKIFQIFERLHNQELFPGTGIGLAICKKIVERYGGKLWVESDGEENKGSEFIFTLPKGEN